MSLDCQFDKSVRKPKGAVRTTVIAKSRTARGTLEFRKDEPMGVQGSSASAFSGPLYSVVVLEGGPSID